jgi:hypothetical protein
VRRFTTAIAGLMALSVAAAIGIPLVLLAALMGAASNGCLPVNDPGRAFGAAAAALSGGWVNPLHGRLSSPFGMRLHPITGHLKLHDGQDLAGAVGTPVVAAASGTAVVESSTWGGPHLVTIDHGGGVQTVYGHMLKALIPSGTRVAAGQRIGVVGSEGYSTGPHLHFTVRVAGEAVDPTAFMQARGIGLGRGPATGPAGSQRVRWAGTLLSATRGDAARAASLPSSWTGTAATGEEVTLDHTQLGFAAQFVDAGHSLGVPEDGIVIALMVPFVESRWKNYASTVYPATRSLAYPAGTVGTGHDSVGLTQARPQSGWGSPTQLMDPGYAAAALFGGPAGPNHGSPRGLLDIPGWQAMSPGTAAQAVQGSAFPDRYAVWETAARELLAVVQGGREATDQPVCVATSTGNGFTLASFNILGDSHTERGGHHAGWRSGPQRMPDQLTSLEAAGVSVAGLQEFQATQWDVVRTSDTWDVYPQTRRHTQNGIIWRRADWTLVRGEQFTIPYFHGTPARQSLVQLRQVTTGQTIFVVNVHNPADVRGAADPWRRRALLIERNLVDRLKATGAPVFITGDFNEVDDPHCTFTPLMQNAFGPGSTSPCRAPRAAAIDQIYGLGGFTFVGTRQNRSMPDRQLSDHPLVTTRVVPTPGREGELAEGGPATRFALAQVGDAYVWGAAGPSAWDCSGLMLEAFRTEGVILPRTSREQARVGQPVSKADIQPGDLIFYYSPVSHVAMYIGGGRIVHAARPGVGVVIAPVSQMEPDIVAIRRITPTVRA